MPESDRRDDATAGRLIFGAFALMLGIALIGFVWTSIDTAASRREIAREQAERRCQGARDTNCESLVANLRSAAAAELASDYAGQQLWVGIVGLIGLGATVAYAAGAWTAARASANAATESNRIGRETLVADQRAWMELLNVTLDAPGLIWENQEATATFSISLKNVGKTPAVGVWIDLRFHFDFTEMPTAVRDRMIANAKTAPEHFGNLIFVGHPFNQQIRISITKQQIADVESNFEKAFGPGTVPSSVMPLFLVGVVSYCPMSGMERRYTAFILQVRQSVPLKLTPMRYQDYSPAQLELVRSPIGDMTAT